MTANQINLARYREDARHNLVAESQNQSNIALGYYNAQLQQQANAIRAQEVSNNYLINMEKNRIADWERNAQEENMINTRAETRRHNLAMEEEARRQSASKILGALPGIVQTGIALFG